MHWHIDIAVITIAGMDYYLCSVLDGYSRVVVQRDFFQRAREAHPEASPRIIFAYTLVRTKQAALFEREAVDRSCRKTLLTWLKGQHHAFTAAPEATRSPGRDAGS